MITLQLIITAASHLARRETAPCSRHARICGPKYWCDNRYSSNCGHPLLLAQAAISTKGTVGTTGKNKPMMPRTNAMAATSFHSRFLVCLSIVYRLISTAARQGINRPRLAKTRASGALHNQSMYGAPARFRERRLQDSINHAFAGSADKPGKCSQHPFRNSCG